MVKVKEVIAALQALNKPDAPVHLEYNRWISEDIKVTIEQRAGIDQVFLIAVTPHSKEPVNE